MRQPDAETIRLLDDVLTQTGCEPSHTTSKLAREMMHTAIKLVQDGANTGELKLTSRSVKELRYALKVFRPYRDIPKVTIFGSARTEPDHPDYQAAVGFGRQMVEQGWMVITGAGGGIMRAGHGGAGRQASFGVAIRLPFETTANEYIEGDHKLIVFRYFFTRKLIFASQAHAVVLFPGGFGTQDECFEVLTLIQTGKAPLVPVVMVDPPGGTYWKHWDCFVRQELLSKGLVSPEDLSLYLVTDDVTVATQHCQAFYRNFHSQRYVRDELVFRLRQPLSNDQLEKLNADFADLVAEGRIVQGGPLSQEQSHLDLPRLHFTFTRRHYGRLRQMIDQINAFA